MDVAKLRKTVGEILAQKNVAHLYMILKSDSGFELLLADLEDDEATEGSLRALFTERVKKEIVENEDLRILEVSSGEHDSDAVFRYDADRHPDELDLFFSFDTGIRVADRELFDFKNNSLDNHICIFLQLHQIHHLSAHAFVQQLWPLLEATHPVPNRQRT